MLGALFEKNVLRKVHKFGHVPELLVTFGLSYVLLELVQLVWGRSAMDYQVPASLQGPLFTIIDSSRDGIHLAWRLAAPALCQSTDAAVQIRCTQFPAYRGFMMLVSVGMLAALYLGLTRTRIGLVIQASLTHPDMVEALGHNVPLVFMAVFGVGAALAALAGAVAGAFYTTNPNMAIELGVVVFVVVVVGGLGSLEGAMLASLLIGIITSLTVGVDASLADLLGFVGARNWAEGIGGLFTLKLSSLAGTIPFALMLLILLVRPRGLLGEKA